MGGVPWDVTEAALKSTFQLFGNIQVRLHKELHDAMVCHGTLFSSKRNTKLSVITERTSRHLRSRLNGQGRRTRPILPKDMSTSCLSMRNRYTQCHLSSVGLNLSVYLFKISLLHFILGEEHVGIVQPRLWHWRELLLQDFFSPHQTERSGFERSSKAMQRKR